jgi:adenine-specific DNA methylase
MALLERIIAASSDENDLVLDPFSGSGTTGIAAARLGLRYVGIEMDCNYLDLTKKRYELEYSQAGYSPLMEYARGVCRDLANAPKHRPVIPGALFGDHKEDLPDCLGGVDGS